MFFRRLYGNLKTKTYFNNINYTVQLIDFDEKKEKKMKIISDSKGEKKQYYQIYDLQSNISRLTAIG